MDLVTVHIFDMLWFSLYVAYNIFSFGLGFFF